MPICTTCTNLVPYLYTVYESAFNLRLERCTNCNSFADPYVEHDALLLFIDLILLKRGVYRHLLHNRGSEPRLLGSCGKGYGARPPRWRLVPSLGVVLVSVDAFIRWAHLNPHTISPFSTQTIIDFFRTFMGCFAETLAFHLGVLLASYVVLSLTPRDINTQFRFSLIPLSLFYSSITKLFLLFLLSIWKPSSTAFEQYPQWMTLLDDDKEWIVRNVLGGMSAGFGLRVVLDCHPMFTMLIILVGWIAKTAMARVVGAWVGGRNLSGEEWLAYSIP